MRLRLPDDPPALLHNVACLLEVVAPDMEWLAREVERAEAEGDSEDGRRFFAAVEQHQAAAALAGIPVEALRLRLTVFAAGEILWFMFVLGC